jgi:purine nucleosidase/pyrimidine-specific ribonucleoside hydrolase
VPDVTPVIIDCDPGHDDVFAIWLAAGRPELDLRAITTVAGNGTLADVTQNARIACTVAGIGDVPIAAGADRPLVRPARAAPDIHGENALGGPALPDPTVPLDQRSAIGLIADVLEASSEPVVLIPTGPLTNLAQLVQQRPDLLSRIREIVWMGGSIGPGNRTPYAEYNAWADPEAAEVVLGAGLPFTMVGLTVTHQALTTSAVMARIAEVGNATARFGTELLAYYCSSYDAAQGMPDGPLHDPVAVALVADPTVVETVRGALTVEVSDPIRVGATTFDPAADSTATVGTSLRVDRFWDLVVGSVAMLA